MHVLLRPHSSLLARPPLVRYQSSSQHLRRSYLTQSPVITDPLRAFRLDSVLRAFVQRRRVMHSHLPPFAPTCNAAVWRMKDRTARSARPKERSAPLLLNDGALSYPAHSKSRERTSAPRTFASVSRTIAGKRSTRRAGGIASDRGGPSGSPMRRAASVRIAAARYGRAIPYPCGKQSAPDARSSHPLRARTSLVGLLLMRGCPNAQHLREHARATRRPTSRRAIAERSGSWAIAGLGDTPPYTPSFLGMPRTAYRAARRTRASRIARPDWRTYYGPTASLNTSL
ncbi:hypothetical protein DFH06DRAFT_533508 [Mycena polygramma]|nr:hypothetical protein DFH06DRAFT_533508 [Mycena polygramma]